MPTNRRSLSHPRQIRVVPTATNTRAVGKKSPLYTLAGQSTTLPPKPRQPVQKLRDERIPVVLADFIDRADVGMVERGSNPSLASEAFQSLRVLRHIVREELQGDKATKLCVFSVINNTHPSTAELFDDAIVRDGLVDHGVGRNSGCNGWSAAKAKLTGTVHRWTQERANLTICGLSQALLARWLRRVLPQQPQLVSY